MNPSRPGNRGSHLIRLDRLIPKARKRLREIKEDDLDELMSFRISSKERVWCIQSENIMRILWWDPRHEVCPSQLKGT